tara:strand:+ start:544 stop:951 length:408 start_codon:yes stop_codon:yes gene_type:complete
MNSLTSKQIIYLNLLFLLPIKELCIKIINLKKHYEMVDAYNYHIERWETISSKYFKSFEYNKWDNRIIHPYIIDDIKYIIEQDTNFDFFNETKISYQSRDLLMTLIKCPKEYRIIDDILYGKLSNMIHEIMKVVS